MINSCAEDGDSDSDGDDDDDDDDDDQKPLLRASTVAPLLRLCLLVNLFLFSYLMDQILHYLKCSKHR